MYLVRANAVSVKELRELKRELKADLFDGVEFQTQSDANRFINDCREIVSACDYWIEQI